MFEKAARTKLRFVTQYGSITTEDLWDLSLSKLDVIAIKLADKRHETSKSFIAKKPVADELDTLAFDIVKHIINTKIQELKDREKASKSKIKRDKINNIIADKEDDTLRDTSIKDLKKMAKKA